MNKEYPSKKNRSLFEGYVFSFSRSKFNLVQMRVLFRIVEYAQAEIEGLVIAQNLCRISHNLRDVTISLPTSSLLSEGSKHYEQVARAVKAMQGNVMEYFDSEQKVWHSGSIVENVEISQGSGRIVFSVPNWIWDSLLDFSRGFRKLELSVVMSMRSANTMKMYQLLAGQRSPIEYRIDWLKSYFGVADKYSQPTDFIKKIIQPAQAEMDKMCPVGFEYVPMRNGRKFETILFKPFSQEEYIDKNLERQNLLARIPASLLSAEGWKYMRYNMGFEVAELAANKKLLDGLAHNCQNLLELLSSIEGRRRGKDGSIKGKGWVIAALKSELAQAVKKKRQTQTF